jgi:hypothetical protein
MHGDLAPRPSIWLDTFRSMYPSFSAAQILVQGTRVECATSGPYSAVATMKDASWNTNRLATLQKSEVPGVTVIRKRWVSGVTGWRMEDGQMTVGRMRDSSGVLAAGAGYTSQWAKRPEVELTTLLHLVMRLRMFETIPSLHPACLWFKHRDNFYLTLYPM